MTGTRRTRSKIPSNYLVAAVTEELQLFPGLAISALLNEWLHDQR